MLKHLTLAVTLVGALPAFAQEATDHSAHMMGDMGPSSMAFMEANDRMHENMMMEYTGNADVDFVKGMIPHHQGAVEMAKIVLGNVGTLAASTEPRLISRGDNSWRVSYVIARSASTGPRLISRGD